MAQKLWPSVTHGEWASDPCDSSHPFCDLLLSLPRQFVSILFGTESGKPCCCCSPDLIESCDAVIFPGHLQQVGHGRHKLVVDRLGRTFLGYIGHSSTLCEVGIVAPPYFQRGRMGLACIARAGRKAFGVASWLGVCEWECHTASSWQAEGMRSLAPSETDMTLSCC